MTVSITVAPPSSKVGWGIGLTVASTFIGPLASGSQWGIVFSNDAAKTQLVWQESFGTISPASRIVIPGIQQLGLYQNQTHWPAEGATVYVEATLYSGVTSVDSAQITATWSVSAGLPFMVFFWGNYLSFSTDQSFRLNAILTAVRQHKTTPGQV